MNAASTTSRFPTFRTGGALLLRFIKACARHIQRLFLSRTSIKVYLITATLICLTYTSLRWVGRRALQAEKERVAALGMIADPALWPALPPHPPDSENFFAAPIFEGIFQPPYPEAPHLRMWFGSKSYLIQDAHGRSKYKYFSPPKADTLAAWCEKLRMFGELPDPPQHSTPAQELLTDHRWDATIKALYAAAARPQARYPRDPVSFLDDSESVRMRGDIIGPMMRSLHLYGRAQLKSGNTGLAVPVLQITRHLMITAESDGYANLRMNAYLRNQKMLLMAGIAAHLWPADALEAIQLEEYPRKTTDAGRRALNLQRLTGSRQIENYKTTLFPYMGGPSRRERMWKYLVPDWFYMRGAVTISRYHAAWHQAARPMVANETWPARIQELNEPLNFNFAFGQFYGYGDFTLEKQRELFVVSHILPIYEATLQHLSIGLELHYLKNGRYPKSLAELDSQLPPYSLMDVDGAPLRYQTNADGAWFTLFSVGWDRIADAPDAKIKNDLIYSTDPRLLLE